MSKLQTPKHKETRAFLRVAGLWIAVTGLIFLIIGFVSIFWAGAHLEEPRLGWCAFVGMPLLFVGGCMLGVGFLGAVSRYVAAEQVPVATDAISDLAEGTQGAVETVARAMAKGVQEAQQEKSNKPQDS
jgi:hypothetical protein